MPEDTNGYSSTGNDTQRDMGSKGGPTTTLGNPDDNHNISHPYSSDIQTQLAAKSNEKKNVQNNESDSPTAVVDSADLISERDNNLDE